MSVESRRSGVEPRTIRELREAIQEVEAVVERLHMAPAVALAWGPEWYLRKARLALRQAERHAATGDDPRLPDLEPMRPQLSDRRPTDRPKRKRHRCTTCFQESLRDLDEKMDCHRRTCDGVVEPVKPLRRQAR